MPRKFIPESPDPFLMTQREYADDAAAIAAGLKVGELYSRPSGAVHVVK